MPGQTFFNVDTPVARCGVLEAWTATFPPGNYPSAFSLDLMQKTLPGFRAAVFSKYFGKSYVDLDNRDRMSVHQSLKGCFNDWRRFGLVFAFGHSSSQYSLAWIKKVTDDEGAGASAPGSPDAPVSAATVEARGLLRSPLLLETPDFLVFFKGCGNRFGFTIAEVVARKPAEFHFSAGNAEYRGFLESTVFPALTARCAGAETFSVSNYLVGIHVTHDTLVEGAAAERGKPERPINDLVVKRNGGIYQYQNGSFGESSLAEIRRTRANNLAATEAKSRAEEDTKRAAIETARGAAANRAQIRQQTLAALAAKTDTASKWYRGMMTAKGISRAEYLRQIGPVSLSINPPARSPISSQEFSALVMKAASGAGIVVSPKSHSTFEVSFDFMPRKYSATTTKGALIEAQGGAEYTLLSSEIKVNVWAMVRRPFGFVPARVTVAFGNVVSAKLGLVVSAQEVAAVLQDCFQAVFSESGRLSGPAVSDEEWMDLTAAYAGSALQQHRDFEEKMKSQAPGAMPGIQGLDKITRVDQVLPPGLQMVERLVTTTPTEMLLDLIGPVNPRTRRVLTKDQPPPSDAISLWSAALADRKIAVDPKNVPAGFLPILVQRFGSVGLPVQVGDREAGPSAVLGQAVVFEPNCMVQNSAYQFYRVDCATASATVLEPEAYAGDAFRSALDKSMASLLAQLDAAPRASRAEPDLLPTEPYTVEVAYQRLNRRRFDGAARPLIVRILNGGVVVAGFEKATGEFKVIELPDLSQVRDAMRGHRGRTPQQIVEYARTRFEGFRFIEANYGLSIGDPEQYADKLSRLPVTQLDVPPKLH